MPSLRHWFDLETERLAARGKTALIAQFDTFNAAFFGGDYEVALRLIPETARLAERLNEPGWSVVMDYYSAASAMGWLGHLADGLERATQTVIRAENLRDGQTLGWYAREMLLGAWLDVDGPGYREHVEAALDKLPSGDLSRDLRARFEGVRARCEALAGQGESARDRWLAAVPRLDWPRCYVEAAQADTLVWVGRHDEAAKLYASAETGFERLRLPIERNGVRLGRAETLLSGGYIGMAEKVARQALHTAQRSINRGQVGRAEGLIGQILLERRLAGEAAIWLERALGALDGRGWWRLEAELAVAYVAALARSGDVAGVEGARATAAWCIRRLGPASQVELEAQLEAVS